MPIFIDQPLGKGAVWLERHNLPGAVEYAHGINCFAAIGADIDEDQIRIEPAVLQKTKVVIERTPQNSLGSAA